MQIQYCEECGTRVDDTEAVLVAGKYYCKQCAPNHVPAQKTGGTAVLAGPPRSSTRAQRPTKPSPGRGLGTAANSISPAINTRFAASGERTAGRESGEYQSVRERTAPPKVGAVDAAYQWAVKNKALAIALAAGVAGIFAFVVWSSMSPGRGGRSTLNTAKTTNLPTPEVTQNSTQAVLNATNGPKASTVVSTTPATTPAVSKAPATDPRMDKAIRDLKGIKEAIAAGKTSPYELRKRLEKLAEPPWFKKEPVGIEAAELLQKYKAEKRSPDKSDGAVPGVTVNVSDEKTVEAQFNTDFKAVDVKTLQQINFPNEAALKTTFGREAAIALKFTGFIDIPKDGEYTFYINSDDGSILVIGDMTIDNGGPHAMTERDGTMEFKAGKHAFRLEYYNGAGPGGLVFSWSGPGIAKQVVPATALFYVPKK